MPTPARTLQLAPVALYLSAKNIDKKNLFGGTVDWSNPTKIFNVYKILKHVYDKDPNYTGLQKRCDYLYELLKRQAVAAVPVVDGGSGGSVAPVTPGGGALPAAIDFIVSASSFMVTGDSTKNIPTFIGFDLNFARGGVTQYTTNPGDGSSYYTWNKVTGDFFCFGPAGLGDQFRFSL